MEVNNLHFALESHIVRRKLYQVEIEPPMPFGNRCRRCAMHNCSW